MTEVNLRYMRLFYQTFKNCDTLRHKLTWTHYRILLRVKDETARNWYMNEAANQTWSTRQLDRQISVLYYERLLASQDKKAVQIEAKTKLSEIEPQQFIHAPYVLEFLNLKIIRHCMNQQLSRLLLIIYSTSCWNLEQDSALKVDRNLCDMRMMIFM